MGEDKLCFELTIMLTWPHYKRMLTLPANEFSLTFLLLPFVRDRNREREREREREIDR